MVGKVLRRPAPGTVLGGLALMVALSGVAVAGIPGEDGTVAACYSQAGSLRVVDAEGGASCRDNETQVSLAATGPGGKVADADKLDGKDSGDFLTAGSKAADSDKLDGKDSTSFARVLFEGTQNSPFHDPVPAGSCRRGGVVIGYKYTDNTTREVVYESGTFGPDDKATIVQGRMAPTLVLTSQPTTTQSMPGGGDLTQTNYVVPIALCNMGSQEATMNGPLKYAVLDTAPNSQP